MNIVTNDIVIITNDIIILTNNIVIVTSDMADKKAAVNLTKCNTKWNFINMNKNNKKEQDSAILN